MGRTLMNWLSTCLASGNPLTEAEVWAPCADLYRTRNGWLIKYDLAGVLPEDVKLAIDGPRLTLHGVRRDCFMEEGSSHYRMEISYSRFERTIELPEPIEPAQITLQNWRGFLLVRIEKQ